MQEQDVIIVGAGASGLAAAAEAARAGASVLVLEKNHVPGRKILSTGSGKCNFSNIKISPASYHPPSAAFLKKTFASLPPARVRAFFGDLGLLWTKDEKGRLFPRSMKAQDVVNVLTNELSARAVRVQTLTEVTGIFLGEDGFIVEAQKVPPQWDKKGARGEKLRLGAGRVILAAGGPCYPQIGGTAGGYELLRKLGHTVSPVRPSMVPLAVKGNLTELDGVRLEARLDLKAGGKHIARTQGELLFTSGGVSGPAVLDLSRAALEALKEGTVIAEADFFPDYVPAAMARLLTGRMKSLGDRTFSGFCAGLHNEKLLKTAAGLAAIPWQAPAGQLSGDSLAAFAVLIKAFPLEITGSRGFEDAMVAAGGCAASEVCPVTFESKKVKGLYVTGELLNIDGDSGGYNLHLAWTSGILAGRAAAGK